MAAVYPVRPARPVHLLEFMRVRVGGGSGFVGAHVERELARAWLAPVDDAPLDVQVHLTAAEVRPALDDAWRDGVRLFVLLSLVGADAGAREAARAGAGRAEELVRASGLPWIIVRPEILWGRGDVFTNELARLVRRLPFVPVPRRGGARLAPVHVADAAAALVATLARPELWRRTWSLRGPEELTYAEVVARVSEAALGPGRRRVALPAWSVRVAASLEERAAGRPRASRRIVDWRVAAGDLRPRVPPLPIEPPRRTMTVEALREHLGAEERPEEQIAAL